MEPPGASSLGGFFGDTRLMARHRAEEWKTEFLARVHLYPKARVTQLALNQQLQ